MLGVVLGIVIYCSIIVSFMLCSILLCVLGVCCRCVVKKQRENGGDVILFQSIDSVARDMG